MKIKKTILCFFLFIISLKASAQQDNNSLIIKRNILKTNGLKWAYETCISNNFATNISIKYAPFE